MSGDKGIHAEFDSILAQAKAGKLSRRQFLTRTTVLGLGAGLATALFGKVTHANEPKKGGLLRVGLTGGESTDTLDPALAGDVLAIMAGMTWGEKLLDVTPEGALDLRLADDVSSNAEGSVWTFRIRKGITFHNGAAVTAEDVAKTYLRHIDERSNSGAAGILTGISDIRAGADKVTIKLEKPNADLPYLLTDFRLVIQPAGGVDRPDAAIGAGPYEVDSFEPGVIVRFTKYANYFDSTIGHVAEIEFLSINDDTSRLAALRAGQVQMINRVSPRLAKELAGAGDISVMRTRGRGHYVFVMHCDTAPFDNNDLRMALKLSVRRQEMVDKILGGFGTVGNDFPINSGYPLFDETIPQREYDAAAASESYKKSGHDGSPIVLEIAAAAFPGAVDAANLFASSAQETGIPLHMKLVPDDGYWSEVWNVRPFCASYWSGRNVQDPIYSMAYLSTAEWNDTHFRNQTFDQLLYAARGELDQAKRKEQYSQMAHILRDEGGVIVPMFNDFLDGVRNDVQGWESDRNAEMMNWRAPVRCWIDN